jgi:hypothetical protein
MSFWIFKVSDQGAYPDTAGREYVYDNTHSVRVAGGDEFIYLEKSGVRYGLTGAGYVSKVSRRRAIADEQRSVKVEQIFTAHLADVAWFSKPFDLSARTKTGRRNRRAVGLPDDLNAFGWSISMPKVERELFLQLLDASLDSGHRSLSMVDDSLDADWNVEDSWSLVRTRCRMQRFREAVLARHNYTCVVCGTRLRAVLDAAHIRSYAANPKQRANPANGICLCSFCHGAFDGGELLILPDGSLRFSSDLRDEIALMHFSVVSADQRLVRLKGIDEQLLLERCSNK